MKKKIKEFIEAHDNFYVHYWDQCQFDLYPTKENFLIKSEDENYDADEDTEILSIDACAEGEGYCPEVIKALIELLGGTCGSI